MKSHSEGEDVQQWQPIETAPDQRVLAFAAGIRRIVSPVYKSEGRMWWCDSGAYVSPTHWMPLPDPPEETRA